MLLLTVSALFAQGVGFLFRVLLSRLVGAEVMGLYHLVLPAYGILLSLTSVGFSTACSALTARYQGLEDERGANQVLGACLTGFLASFFLLALAVLPLSDWLSVRLLGDARTRLGLVLLLPCVLLTGVENLHKHAFYGLGQVTPPALTEMGEQLLRAGAVLGLLVLFPRKNAETTVGLIILGMVICECFSALTLTLLRRRSPHPVGGVPPKALRRQILRVALPVGWSALLGNLLSALLAVTIPARLVEGGAPVEEAMAALGVLQGMTLPLMSLPAVFLTPLALTLLPRLTRAAAQGRKEDFRQEVHRAFTLVSRLVLPASALLTALAFPLCRLLYRQPQAGELALPLSLGVVLTAWESLLALFLNGLGEQPVTARNGLLSGAVQAGLTWWRMGVPGAGVRGYAQAFLLSSLLGLLLNWLSLRRRFPLRVRWFPWVVAPGLAALLSGVWTGLVFPLLIRSGLGEALACGLSLLLGVLLYLLALWTLTGGREP